MRVLVTGGAGFIGSHVVDQLLDEGHRVVVADSLDPAAHHVRPSYLRPDAELIEGDLADEAVVVRAVRGVDAVCHQAARVGLGVNFDDVSRYVHDNDVGTAALLRAMWTAGFQGRLVVASSMVVYGEGRYRCTTHGETHPGPRLAADLDAGRFEPPCPHCGARLEPEFVDESAPLEPRNVYAATKVHTEHLAQLYGREAGVPVTLLRYHNVYGPRMPRDTPYAGVASLFRSALAGGRPPEVFEDGGQRRDFVHVSDVARANVLALTVEPAVPGPFNVASGEPKTVGDLATALAEATNPALVPVVTGRHRPGDVRHVVASPARAARELGFSARVRFREGITEFAHAPLRGAAR
jgi:dTDP-L-rhamnose 4-epimerase